MHMHMLVCVCARVYIFYGKYCVFVIKSDCQMHMLSGEVQQVSSFLVCHLFCFLSFFRYYHLSMLGEYICLCFSDVCLWAVPAVFGTSPWHVVRSCILPRAVQQNPHRKRWSERGQNVCWWGSSHLWACHHQSDEIQHAPVLCLRRLWGGELEKSIVQVVQRMQ